MMTTRPLQRLANVVAAVALLFKTFEWHRTEAAAFHGTRAPPAAASPVLLGPSTPSSASSSFGNRQGQRGGERRGIFFFNCGGRGNVKIREKRSTRLFLTSTADASSFSTSNEPYEGLASSYPEGTPPGLRGEAIRSALRSGKCLAYRWRHRHEERKPLDCGLVRVHGKGTRAFLHSKLTKSFLDGGRTPSSSSFRSACLLNGKGQVVDRVHVAVVATKPDRETGGEVTEEEEAFVLTSPGHSSTELFRRLDPFVFPLDRVTLTDCSPTTNSASSSESSNQDQQQDGGGGGCIFSLAAADRASVQQLFDRAMVPQIKKWMTIDRDDDGGKNDEFRIELPTAADATTGNPGGNAAVLIRSSRGATSGPCSLLIVPYAHLPECAAVGYMFYLWDEDSNEGSGWTSRQAGSAMWQTLLDDADGPIHVGPLEWETLRIEAGQPRYGCEYTGGLKSSKKKKTDDTANPLLETTVGASNDNTAEGASPKPTITPASPLELHLDETIDLEKGCYLGQEGVASVLKNPRGPPRTLYQVVFDDECNHYDDNDDDSNDDEEREASGDNLTRPPAPGDTMFVLGSNQEISAGILTSVAEPGGTGEPVTVGLALVPRADSILKRMADRGLTITARDAGSPTLSPPISSHALPLDGLEVIVGGTFTVGRLQAVPVHRYRQGENMFLDNPSDSFEDESQQRWNKIRLEPDEAESSVDDSRDPWETDATATDSIDGAEMEVSSKEADEARAAAEAEAKRKAEKMELLRKRAEEALAKRRNKKNA
jgi:folate-binding Fe-S cluster repair protein YgfZ